MDNNYDILFSLLSMELKMLLASCTCIVLHIGVPLHFGNKLKLLRLFSLADCVCVYLLLK